MTWRLRPLIERFGDRPIGEIKTADVEDWIADLRKPRMRFGREHVLAAASVNRSIEILRHMLNWAIGREYLDKTPFRRGTETLVRKLREDNMRRRRISEESNASWRHSDVKCRRAKARPEPDFRYRSNRRAGASAGNSTTTSSDHGLWLTVCPDGPWLCHSTRFSTLLVTPV
jgi:hypothetical protein